MMKTSCKLVYKEIRNMGPTVLNEMFMLHEPSHELRSSYTLVHVKCPDVTHNLVQRISQSEGLNIGIFFRMISNLAILLTCSRSVLRNTRDLTRDGETQQMLIAINIMART